MNPFADLIPQNAQQAPQQAMPQQAPAQNPFMDLIPANNNVARGTSALMGNAASTMPASETGQEGRHFLNNFGRKQAANIAGFGRSLVNTPHRISSRIPAVVPEDFNYHQALGVEQGLADKVVQGVLEFSPFARAAKMAQSVPKIAKLFSKAPNLATGVAAGTAFGAVNAPEDEKMMGALFGGGAGALGVGAGKVADAGIRKIAEKYAQTAIPGLVNKATDTLKKHISPDKSARVLQQKYNVAAKTNAGNWEKTNQLANTLDTELKKRGHAFNGSRFIQDIDKGIERIAKKEPAKRAKYEHALGFANYIKQQTPQSFSGAITLRQNLNQELKKYLEKQNLKSGDREVKTTVSNLKKVLDDTIKDNKKYVSKTRFNQFNKDWMEANKSHSSLQEFFKTPNPQGVLKPRLPRREALASGQLDAGAIGQYVRPSMRGTAGIDQLRKLTGNNNAARAYAVRNLIEGRGNQNALSLYEKLPPAQREALFKNTKSGEVLNAASHAKNTVGMPAEKSFGNAIGHHIGALGVPGLLGFAGAKAAGEDTEKSLLYGAGAALAAKGSSAGTKALISKYATRNPNSVIKAANRAVTPGKHSGHYLSPILASMFAGRKEKE